jgi:hypothetical protein
MEEGAGADGLVGQLGQSARRLAQEERTHWPIGPRK